MTKEQRDALLYQPKNGYDRLTQADLSLMFCSHAGSLEPLLVFLEASSSEKKRV